VMLVAEGNRLYEPGRVFIERSGVGKARIAARPRGIELPRDLDFEIGVLFLKCPEFVRFADTGRNEGVCSRGQRERGKQRCESRKSDCGDLDRSGDEVATPRMIGGHARTAGPFGVSNPKLACEFFRRPIADACDDPTNTASHPSVLFAIPTF